MEIYFMFVGAVFLISLGLILFYKANGIEIKSNAMGGIKAFWLFGVIVGLLMLAIVYLTGFIGKAEAAETELIDEFNWAAFLELGLGLDYVSNGDKSPQCEPTGTGYDNGPNDRLTSNGGIKLNIMEYRKEILVENKPKLLSFEVNGKYTHHSCAVSDDDLMYDGTGIQAVFRIRRK